MAAVDAGTNARAALDTLVEASDTSLAALSRMIGRNGAYLQQFVRRGSPRRLAESDRRLIAAYLGVDETVLGAEPAAERGIAVAKLRVRAAAGAGRINDNERAAAMWFDPATLRMLGVAPQDAALLRAAGDSMTPTIDDGDLILVDQRDRSPGREGRPYVLRVGEALFVKRVARVGGRMIVTSDNRGAAGPFDDAGAEVIIVGRVVWLSRMIG